MEECIIKSPLGFIKIKGDQDGVTLISVLNSEEKPSKIIPEVLEDCVLQLNAYFKGKRKQFNLKTNPKGTDFQKQVWSALRSIPYGKSTSYLKLSQKLGNPKAIRAVANANGKNPLCIIIPCHRVIGSNGDLVGYASGLHRKKWLLEHETPYKQESLF